MSEPHRSPRRCSSGRPASSGGAEIEAAVDRNLLALTRFANSVIHQNVADDVVGVRLRVHRDGRTASGSTTAVDDEGLQALVDRTLAAVAVAPLDPGWPGLAPPAPPGAVAAVDPATAAATPDDRAGVVAAFVEAAGGLEAAGYCRTDHWPRRPRQLGRPELIRRVGRGRRRRHRPVRPVPTAWRVPRPGGWPTSTARALGARAAAKARAGGDAVELAARPLRGRARTDGRRRRPA